MTLESLKLVNFQCHSKLEIEFDPHVTTIVGPNDVGKSAILRALRWICLNRPAGEEFRKWDTRNTIIRLTVDGHIIKRKRGNSTNTYSLDGSVYKAFGTDVPSKITTLLNLSENNFQNQLEPAFWFSEVPSQVAKNLNKIINLGVIDDALEYIAKETRRAKSVVEVSRLRLADARTKKKELAWVPTFHQKVEDLENKEQEILELKKKSQSLHALLGDMAKHKQQASIGTDAILVGQKLVKKAMHLQESRKLIDELKKLVERLARQELLIEDKKKVLKLLQDKLAKVHICPVCGKPIKS